MTAATVTIPLGDIKIREAGTAAADGDTWYIRTMPLVLAVFTGIDNVTYWELSVAEHQRLCVVAATLRPNVARACDLLPDELGMGG